MRARRVDTSSCASRPVVWGIRRDRVTRPGGRGHGRFIRSCPLGFDPVHGHDHVALRTRRRRRIDRSLPGHLRLEPADGAVQPSHPGRARTCDHAARCCAGARSAAFGSPGGEGLMACIVCRGATTRTSALRPDLVECVDCGLVYAPAATEDRAEFGDRYYVEGVYADYVQ